MSDMVAKVSAAIGCIDADRCNGLRPSGTCDQCLAAGRRAIEAMREPTEAMTESGGWHANGSMQDRKNAENIWREMIAAALEEPK